MAAREIDRPVVMHRINDNCILIKVFEKKMPFKMRVEISADPIPGLDAGFAINLVL